MKRWPLAIILFFVILVIADAYFVFVALDNPDPVVESYQTNER